MGTGRYFVIGDIHGQVEKLEQLLASLPWRSGQGDLLIFLGDYIDYGPQSAAVVNLVSGLVVRHPEEVIALRGDHEEKFLNFISGRAKLDQSCGQEATVRSYQSLGLGGKFSSEHLFFLRNLRSFYQAGDYVFVHAGLRPGVALEDQNSEDLLSIGEDFLSSDYDFGYTVVFGHTPQARALVAPGRLGLDTGAAQQGPLTAVILPDMEFKSV